MIIIQLKGGLGNQMFQYAAAYALAKKNNDILKLDLTGYDSHQDVRGQIKRNPDILQFSLKPVVATRREIEAIKNPHQIFSKISRFIKKSLLHNYQIDWEPNFINQIGDVYLDGYFQTEKYFESVIGDLLLEFQPHQILLDRVGKIQQIIESHPVTVSMHVRRGDYVLGPVNSALYNVCNENYFRNAISEMKKLVGDFQLIIFSDEINWVKANFDFLSDAYFIDGDQFKTSPVEEIWLMSKCSHHILANSTFSWWGAYLNRRNDKRIIAPKLWNHSKKFPHKDIIPSSWNIIRL